MKHDISFELPSDPGAMRNVNSEAVEALDAALKALGPEGRGEVMHAIDPRRILALPFGGPPVWSVAQVEIGDGSRQYLTYGLSSAVDPESPYDFELTMRVQGADDSMWPVLLLRHLARYQLVGGRPIEPGEYWALGGAITRSAVPLEMQANFPDTRLNSVFIIAGEELSTPHGDISLRNVVGLDSAERALREQCTDARFT